MSPDRCIHCGSRIPAEAPEPGFCCRGCHAVHQLLVGEGLTRFYALQTQRAPVATPTHDHSFAWLDELIDESRPICTLELDVQGIHCAGCVWLMEELFRRQGGGVAIVVNPALGKLRLSWRGGAFDVRAFLGSVERFGYAFGASRKRSRAASSDLPLRLGICAAITINVMLFSFSFYTGLAPSDGVVFILFSRLVLGLTCVVVLVGGSVFFRSAWQGLKRGILHLDLPIAAGILLAFGASLVQARSGRGDHAYLDTLDVFVTLMLVGRWLQERVLERNRRFLLDEHDLQGLDVRRREGERLVTIDAQRIGVGDRLVLAPGDLLPVDATLDEDAASFTTDWITGEADVRVAARGERLPAGSCNAGRSPMAVVAAMRFAESPLPRLLSANGTAPAHAKLWQRVARVYVVAVLALAAAALAFWWPRDPHRAVDITVALLVVTCPCALGIAGPLAYELVLGRLRRGGFFVRNPDVLDKLVRVRKLIFDKTGTLTLGRMQLESSLDGLSPELRHVAYNLAARSSHPVSRCLAAALADRFDETFSAVEEPGRGVRATRGGHTYALRGAEGSTLLCVDDRPRFAFTTAESVRPDARRELGRLRAAGCDLWLLSGDTASRVDALAKALGIEHARGGLSPDAKAAQVAAIDDRDTLYLGDGVNDSLAFERAFCAGTPAIDRPVLPGKCDFFLLGDGLGAIGEALALSRRLRAVVHRNLAISIVYNALTVTACFAGIMTPVGAAIFMPLSSLSILLATVASLSESSARTEELAWTS
jgi:Cu2+-exporting ATPase